MPTAAATGQIKDPHYGTQTNKHERYDKETFTGGTEGAGGKKEEECPEDEHQIMDEAQLQEAAEELALMSKEDEQKNSP